MCSRSRYAWRVSMVSFRIADTNQFKEAKINTTPQNSSFSRWLIGVNTLNKNMPRSSDASLSRAGYTTLPVEERVSEAITNHPLKYTHETPELLWRFTWSWRLLQPRDCRHHTQLLEVLAAKIAPTGSAPSSAEGQQVTAQEWSAAYTPTPTQDLRIPTRSDRYEVPATNSRTAVSDPLVSLVSSGQLCQPWQGKVLKR